MVFSNSSHFLIGFGLETTYPYAYDIRSYYTKFLGVLADVHLSWTDHINILENKLSKSLGLLNKSKHAKEMKSHYISLYLHD